MSAPVSSIELFSYSLGESVVIARAALRLLVSWDCAPSAADIHFDSLVPQTMLLDEVLASYDRACSTITGPDVSWLPVFLCSSLRGRAAHGSSQLEGPVSADLPRSAADLRSW